MTSSNVIDEIKDRLSIEDLVGQYVSLKKAGRSLKGLCPFHSEKTPSFVVNPERQIAYCFGCNRGGDIFKFIQEIEGVDFGDALKILAERSGVKLEQHRFERQEPQDAKDLLVAVHEKATVFFEKQLWETADGAKVLEYLRARGLTDDSIRQFRVGFSPDSYETTYTMLLKEGFTKKLLVSSGLALTQETTVEKIYDRFRGRLMFPIFDSLGRVVAFGGRALKKEQEPKYLNSPETAIYHKGRVLYGFLQAKTALKLSGEAIVVEGYMDLIAMHQAGVKNAVATSGTAFTPKQLQILKPFIKTLILSFDMDLAGQDAAKRSYELSKEFEYLVKVVTMPEGKDPADYAQQHGSKLAEVVRQARLYEDYFYEKLLKTYGTDNFTSKKKILQEYLPFFQQLKGTIEKDEYIRRLAHDLDLKEAQIYDEIRSLKLPGHHPARMHSSLEMVPAKAKQFTAGELLLGFLLNFPRLASVLKSGIDENLFPERLKPIYKAYIGHYNDVRTGEPASDLLESFPRELKEEANVLSLFVLEKYGEMSEADVEKEVQALAQYLKKNLQSSCLNDLQRKIVEAERQGNTEEWKALLQELNNLRNSYGSNEKVHHPAV